MTLSRDDVENILRIIDTPCVELHLETPDFKLFVRKADHSGQAALANEQAPRAAISTSSPGAWMPSAPIEVPAEHAPVQLARSQRELAANEYALTAPMVGTFYRAPSPGAPPFVEVGDIVGPHTVCCIIEVMKLMNSVRAERPGRVVEILVENAQPVQNGQPLVIIELTD